MTERLYFTFTTPLHVDEAYTFLYFTSKGLWQSMSYYPEPNNHILFSIITALFYYLVPDMDFALRFPAFLISTAVTIFLFFTVKRYTGFWIALLGVSFFCFSNVAVYYSFEARGYFLLLGFCFLAAFSVLDFTLNGKRKNLILYAIGVILGTYTIPVFIYPLFSIAAFGSFVLLFTRKHRLFLQFLVVNLAAGAIIILLYLPVMLVSGLDALIANEFVVSLTAEKFYSGFFWFIKYVGNDLAGKEYYGYSLGVLVTGSYIAYLGYKLKQEGKTAFHQKHFLLILLFLFLQIIPLFIISFQRVFPYPRVWLYLSAFQFIGFAWLLTNIFRFLKMRTIAPQLLLTALLLYGLHQLRVYYRFEKVAIHSDNSLKQVVKFMLLNNPEKVYMQHYYYQVFTSIASEKSGTPIMIDVKQDFKPRVNYNYFLFDNNNTFPPGFDPAAHQKVYHDHYVTIYQKR